MRDLFTQEEDYTILDKTIIALSLFGIVFVVGITIIGFKVAGMI